MEIWKYGNMKTTLELPDELYREVKAAAALKRKKMKDLVARGLELVLEEERCTDPQSPLEVMKGIRSRPPHTHQQVMEWQADAYRTRKEGWDAHA
jgi:hypothetical protein